MSDHAINFNSLLHCQTCQLSPACHAPVARLVLLIRPWYEALRAAPLDLSSKIQILGKDKSWELRLRPRPGFPVAQQRHVCTALGESPNHEDLSSADCGTECGTYWTCRWCMVMVVFGTSILFLYHVLCPPLLLMEKLRISSGSRVLSRPISFGCTPEPCGPTRSSPQQWPFAKHDEGTVVTIGVISLLQLSGFLLVINFNPKGFNWFEALHGCHMVPWD